MKKILMIYCLFLITTSFLDFVLFKLDINKNFSIIHSLFLSFFIFIGYLFGMKVNKKIKDRVF